MFNLLMFNVDWDSGRASVPLGRIFEYTEEHIADMFQQNGSPLLSRLTELPCLFCEEGKTDEVARVGQIVRARVVGGNAILEISFDGEVPPLNNSLIYASRMELSMPHDFEFSRNHWAVKDVDLFRFLLRNVRPRRQRPTVFHIPEHESIETTLASAMMPFDVAFNDVYDCIKQAAKNAGLRCRRTEYIR